jgi:hypothetical protein
MSAGHRWPSHSTMWEIGRLCERKTSSCARLQPYWPCWRPERPLLPVPPLPSTPHMITPGASRVGSSAIPAIAPMRPEPNAWRRHPDGGSCIAVSTGVCCSSGSGPCSSRMCSSAGDTTGITEIRLQGRDRSTLRPGADATRSQALALGRIETSPCHLLRWWRCSGGVNLAQAAKSTATMPLMSAIVKCGPQTNSLSTRRASSQAKKC